MADGNSQNLGLVALGFMGNITSSILCACLFNRMDPLRWAWWTLN
jgi:hypothetical protein